MSNTPRDRYRKRNIKLKEPVVDPPVAEDINEEPLDIEVDEEPLTKEELESIKEAEKDYENGDVLTTKELTKKLELDKDD